MRALSCMTAATLLLLSHVASAQQAQVTYPPPGAAPVFLTDVTLTQSALIAVQLAGAQSFTVSTNCLAGERLIMVPGTTPPSTGYMLGDITCTANGTAVAKLFTPALSIGASYSFTVRVVAFR